MIIVSASLFHVYLPWGQHLFRPSRRLLVASVSLRLKLYLGHADAPPPPLLAAAHHDGEGGGHLLRRVSLEVDVLPRAQAAEGGRRVVDSSTPVQALVSQRNWR